MDYNHIKNFLEKFKKIIFQKEEVKEILTKTISQSISSEVNKESIRVKNGIIFIEASPIIRSEILIHKNQILNNLKIFLPNNNFLDIK